MNNLEPHARKWLRVRIAVLGTWIVLTSCIVVVRAFYLQVYTGSELKEMAEDQHLRDVRISPKRGTVYDRDGLELAVSVEVDSVFANPQRVRASGASPERIAAKLAPILGINRSVIAKRLANGRYFAWIKRRVSPVQAKAVRELHLPGISLTSEARRFYPNRELAAHILGFSNIDGVGVEGLELALDGVLRGADRKIPTVRDNRGRVVFSAQSYDTQSTQGKNVFLTIDKTIQHVAERELELAVRTFEARAGSVVVMEPTTGEILALANYPTFNPNDPGSYPASSRRNRVLTDRFEPGSTVKPFTVATALAAGTTKVRDKIDCEQGRFRVSNRIIHDAHPHAILTPAEILAFSSNIGTAKIAASVGRKNLYRGLRRFGFGEVSGLEVPGEVAGNLRDYRRWFDLDTAAISFGQGMSATSLQLATAMSAIANGGRLMRPILVRQISDGHGRVVEEQRPTFRRQVIPERTARLVGDMLTAVTGPGGTGGEAAIEGYLVAGKTGTAQKADFVSGGYAQGKWVSSFLGFVPADAPRLVISVVIDEPQIAHYGGTVAGPVFRRLGAASLRHLGVAARDSKEIIVELDRVEEPAQEVESAPNTEIEIKQERFHVPSLKGFSARRAIKQLQRRSLHARVHGSGLVAEQRPAAGKKINPGQVVELFMRRPDQPQHSPLRDQPQMKVQVARSEVP